MAVVSTPASSVIKVILNDGTAASGATKTKTTTLFSSTLQKASLDTAGLEAAMAVVELLQACLAKTINSVRYEPVSTLTDDE